MTGDYEQEPEAKGYRYIARRDPMCDLAAFGAVMHAALDRVPVEELPRLAIPALVVNAGNDNHDDAAAGTASRMPPIALGTLLLDDGNLNRFWRRV